MPTGMGSAFVSGLFDLANTGLSFVSYPLADHNSAKAASRNYWYSKALQDDAQEWQKYMYQNQHQWRVADLRAAGLNPILSTHAASAMPSASSSGVSTAPGQGNISNSGFSATTAKLFSRYFEGIVEDEAKKRKADLANAEVDLAQKEADLALKELEAISLAEDINSKMINSSLSKLDLDRRSRDWYKQFEDLRDIRNTYKNSSHLGRFTDDIEGTFARMLLNTSAHPERSSSTPIVIKKSPSKSNFTKYQYKYHKN